MPCPQLGLIPSFFFFGIIQHICVSILYRIPLGPHEDSWLHCQLYLMCWRGGEEVATVRHDSFIEVSDAVLSMFLDGHNDPLCHIWSKMEAFLLHSFKSPCSHSMKFFIHWQLSVKSLKPHMLIFSTALKVIESIKPFLSHWLGWEELDTQSIFLSTTALQPHKRK